MNKKPERTNNEEKLLWKVLKKITKFEHNWTWDVMSGANHFYYCTACGIKDKRNHGGGSYLEVRDKLNDEYLPDRPCLIPDIYPGTEADIAEEIRIWLIENNKKISADTKLSPRGKIEAFLKENFRGKKDE